MAGKKRKKGFSYYFKANLNSFQGRVTLGFLITTSFLMLVIVILSVLRKNIHDTKTIIDQVYYPTIQNLQSLGQKVEESQNNILKYTVLQDNKYRTLNTTLWTAEIQRIKNELLANINDTPDEEASLKLRDLNLSLEEIKKIEENIETNFLTGRNKIGKELIAKDLDFQITSFKTKLNDFIRLEASYIQEVEKKINSSMSAYNWWFWASLFIAFIFAYIMGIVLFMGIFGRIKNIGNNAKEIVKGNLPKNIDIGKDEFRGIVNSLNQLKENLEGVKNYAGQVGKGVFDKNLIAFDKDSELGKAIREMGTSLQKVNEEENKRSWATRGLAEFGEILRNNNDDITKLSKSIVAKLTKYLNVIQAGLFVVIEKDEKEYFELVASYAYEREKFITRTASVEEGLLGRVYFEKEIVYIDNIPDNYTSISSGLGETEPSILLLLPLINDDNKVQGVVELSTFKEFEAYEIEFLRRLAESIAATINFTLTTQNNKQLLEDAQMNSHKLMMQEKMLRGRSKQLEKIQRETNLRLKLAEKDTQKLNVILENIRDAVVVSDTEGNITLFNKAAENIFGYTSKEIKGESINLLMPINYADYHNQHLENYDKTNKPKMIGKDRVLEGKRKNGEVFKLQLLLDEIRVSDKEFIFAAIIRDLEEESQKNMEKN